ncbi:hypothetical protein AB0J14_05025 [Micromonospora arborensis]
MANNIPARAACSCGRCGACAAIISAAVRREAYPPTQRDGIGAAVKGGSR